MAAKKKIAQASTHPQVEIMSFGVFVFRTLAVTASLLVVFTVVTPSFSCADVFPEIIPGSLCVKDILTIKGLS